ncbi:putative glucuronoxylan glucuronosyltransferase IRX7-like [Heracleum sosnowskyi]|uniref:Glucuronoxylan glucuronosyltransferase IRX7-like n=1 Tax=Heracleum sosnowskyi TaxID=360622 RepID=A0AAD8HVG8_9APIA|nr:putative glucuronoxylan glucuronosyltransferase IRX7-like [Heracleum sosnowskyi]
MEQQSPFLTWPYFFHGKTMNELSQSLLVTTLELETTRIRAQEEMKLRDDQLFELTEMLEQTIRDRDEAQEKCQQLLFDKLLLQQQQQQQQQMQLHHFHYKNQTAPHSGISIIQDDPGNGNLSSTDCEESIISSSSQEKDQDFFLPIVIDKELPEKGKFLQAVIKAGPLLNTLLLAGPLPTWQHPPPPLDNSQIPLPPVIVPQPSPQRPQHLHHQDSFMDGATVNNLNKFAGVNRKRGFSEVIDYSFTETR